MIRFGCGVIEFRFKSDVSAKKALQMSEIQYDESYLHKTAVHDWHSLFPRTARQRNSNTIDIFISTNCGRATQCISLL